MATTARCQNNGQSCIAGKRFIVHEAIADEFERRFVENMTALVVGDPMQGDDRHRPLATAAAGTTSRSWWPTLWPKAPRFCGGERLPGPGWYSPHRDHRADSGHRLYSEESFGPLAALFRVENIDEAVAGQCHRLRARRQRLDQ